MNKTLKVFCLFALLLFACADLERNKFYEGDDDGGVVGGVSNSSGGTDKGNDINNYRTVEIGTQTWMAENLDYNVSGSKCYNNLNSNCDIYGRLYNWSTAMALPASCNTSTCSGQIRSPHQGICPDGWHIPSDTDWDVLMSYAGGSSVAGAKLKSVRGWYNNGNGTDQYGFSALPGGYGSSDGSFDYASNFGIWLSANEYNSGNAYGPLIDYISGNAYWGYEDKSFLQSVRCVKDSNGNSSSSAQGSQGSGSSGQNSSSSALGSLGSSSSGQGLSSSGLGSGSSNRVGKGNDINNYRTVEIGTQTWMAENLDYNAAGSKCYDDLDSNCDLYGRLYDWSTAMYLPGCNNSSSCSIQSPHQGICPVGWHIPSDDEWNVLITAVGGSNGAGAKLKAKSGWDDCGPNGSGSSYLCEDTYDFSALPGGSNFGDFRGISYSGYWWSATQGGASGTTGSNAANSAYPRIMGSGTGVSMGAAAAAGSDLKSRLFSVRCVKDSNGNSSSSGQSSSSLVQSSSSLAQSSSSLAQSSSSLVQSSSSSSISYGSVSHGGQTYKTVLIGTQTWFAENLNYNVSGSQCYDNSTARCNTYGRLYNWATAMALPSSCNSTSCASEIQSPHQGICPSGWHIPSQAEWDALSSYVQSYSGCSSCDAKLLKAKSGWNNYNGVSGNGTDGFGFTALPGGYYYHKDGSFESVGNYGHWWSANESVDYSYAAYERNMIYYNDVSQNWGYGIDKPTGVSVRCIKD